MYLAEARKWFKDRVPAATVTVGIERVGADTLEFTRVAKPPARTGAGVLRNHPMTPLVPFRGGVVTLAGGLVAVAGDNRLGVALDVLTSLSALVAPPIATAVTVARGISEGLDKLLDTSGNVELAVHDSYVAPGGGGNELRAGYLAIVAADARKLDPAGLSIEDGRLLHDGAALVQNDFLLFHIESREDRDDWLFPDLQALENEARRKLILDDRDGFEALRQQMLATVVTTPDLTESDRWRVAEVVRARLERARSKGAGAVGTKGDDLATDLQRDVVDLAEARARPPITLDAVLG
jgi:hypothetical protein